MNTTIYATILTGLGIIITLIVTMHNLAKTKQQETNCRIDDLKKDLKELLDAKFRVIDSQFEVVNVRVQKLDREVTEARQEVQDIKKSDLQPGSLITPQPLSPVSHHTPRPFVCARIQSSFLPVAGLYLLARQRPGLTNALPARFPSG